MWLNGHPSLKVAMKILRNTSSQHKKQIIKCFIMNQLLVGSTKRKAFSEGAGGFYPPGLLVISPSMKCNLNCFGCYAGSYSKKGELTFDETCLLDIYYIENWSPSLDLKIVLRTIPYLLSARGAY